jgi:NAD(P)-dependent dehydrogenase (short-subunit alcohol dehydrogenase family)
LVTGASRGIGAAVARRLAAEGADVAITARTLEAHPTLAGSLRETASELERHGGRVAVVVADLADQAARDRIVPEAEAGLGGPIDILVNNAAAAIYKPLLDYPLRRRRLSFEINVHAPIDLAQAVAPGMVARGEGWIINVSSATARPALTPFGPGGVRPSMGVYGASKAALNRITNALAAELASTGVRVNTIEPRAAVMTEGAAAVLGDRLGAAPMEPMEAMVEATLALCDCGPERTGRVFVSLDLIAELGLTVMDLDGVGPMAQTTPNLLAPTDPREETR